MGGGGRNNTGTPPWPRRNLYWDSEYVVTALHNKVLSIGDSNRRNSPCRWKVSSDSLVASNDTSDSLRDIFIIGQSSTYYDMWLADHVNIPLTDDIVYFKNSKYTLPCQMLSTTRISLNTAAQTLTNWDIVPTVWKSVISQHTAKGYVYRIQV